MMPTSRETTARAILVVGDRLLVAKGKDQDFTHLPGGHVENGEQPIDAVKRELIEECGAILSDIKKVGVMSNRYDNLRDGKRVHETIHLYVAKAYPNSLQSPIQKSKESWMEFKWIPLGDLERHRLMPPGVVRWVHQYGGL